MRTRHSNHLTVHNWLCTLEPFRKCLRIQNPISTWKTACFSDVPPWKQDNGLHGILTRSAFAKPFLQPRCLRLGLIQWSAVCELTSYFPYRLAIEVEGWPSLLRQAPS